MDIKWNYILRDGSSVVVLIPFPEPWLSLSGPVIQFSLQIWTCPEETVVCGFSVATGPDIHEPRLLATCRWDTHIQFPLAERVGCQLLRNVPIPIHQKCEILSVGIKCLFPLKGDTFFWSCHRFVTCDAAVGVDLEAPAPVTFLAVTQAVTWLAAVRDVSELHGADRSQSSQWD